MIRAMDTGQPRYLRYEKAVATVSGLNHQVTNLACLLRDAHASGRSAIVPPLFLDAKHNFNVSRDWRWESFFDFRRSRLVDASERKHRLPIAAGPPPSGLRTLRLEPGEATPPDGDSCGLLVRRIENDLFVRDVPAEARPDVALRLCAAGRVSALARPVAERLCSLGRGRFAAVHVRRGDRLREYPRFRQSSHKLYPGRLTGPTNVRSRLLAAGVGDGAVLFVVSDERDAAFWEPLQQHYRVFREADFPALAALLSPSGEPLPDNYLAYQASLEVMRSAYLRVGTFPDRRANMPAMHGFLVDEGQWRRPSLVAHVAVQTVSLCRRLMRRAAP